MPRLPAQWAGLGAAGGAAVALVIIAGQPGVTIAGYVVSVFTAVAAVVAVLALLVLERVAGGQIPEGALR